MFKRILLLLFVIPTTIFSLPLVAMHPQNNNYIYGLNIGKDADKYIGNPYVWGGNSLTNGLDCSAFVKILVKKHIGINLPRTAQNQALNTKKYLSITSLNELKIGDALYFKNKKEHIYHVAFVTGFDFDGYPFITHAKGEKYGIVREKINTNYIDTFFLAKRFSSVVESVVEKENEKIYIPLLLKNL